MRGTVVDTTRQEDPPAQEYDIDRHKSEQGDSELDKYDQALISDSGEPHGKRTFNMGVPKDSDNTSGTENVVVYNSACIVASLV